MAWWWLLLPPKLQCGTLISRYNNLLRPSKRILMTPPSGKHSKQRQASTIKSKSTKRDTPSLISSPPLSQRVATYVESNPKYERYHKGANFIWNRVNPLIDYVSDQREQCVGKQRRQSCSRRSIERYQCKIETDVYESGKSCKDDRKPRLSRYRDSSCEHAIDCIEHDRQGNDRDNGCSRMICGREKPVEYNRAGKRKSISTK